MNRRPVIVHLVSGLFVLAMASHPASGQEIVPSRFAYGMVIDTVGRVPLQQFVLPDTVYRIATRADLGDLRLFNAAGEPLAYAIDRQDSETESPPERIALPFFSLSAAAPSAAGDVRVEVRKTPSGTLVRVDDPPAVGEPAAVYVIDASGLDRPVHALTFTWDESSDDFLTQATLETSDDLTRWEPWGDAITLARLRRMGNVLVREQVDVPPRDAPYYRIRFQHTPPPLSRVTVRRRPTACRLSVDGSIWKQCARSARCSPRRTTGYSRSIGSASISIDRTPSRAYASNRPTNPGDPGAGIFRGPSTGSKSTDKRWSRPRSRFG
jgi:hypothetical protein